MGRGGQGFAVGEPPLIYKSACNITDMVKIAGMLGITLMPMAIETADCIDQVNIET